MATVSDRRVRSALRDALNGDAETVDPAVRRGLTVLAVASDDLEERFDRIERKITSYGTSIIVSVLTAAGAVVAAIVR